MAALPATPLPAPAPTPEPAPLTEAERLMDVFVAPSKTFTDLRRNASWWGPWLLTAIVLVIFAYVVDAKIGFRKVTENQIEMSPKLSGQLDNMSAEDREANIHARTVGTRYSIYGIPVFTLVIYLILAAIYLGSYKFGADVNLTFKLALAVVVYAALPEVVRFLLAILSLLLGASPDSFNPQNPVATNLGFFAGHFSHLVAHPDGHRFYLRDQSEEGHIVCNRVRLVCGPHTGVLRFGFFGVSLGGT